MLSLSLPSWLKPALTARQWGEFALMALVAVRLVAFRPVAAYAQNIDGTFLSGQFKTAFWLARLAVFFMAIIFAGGPEPGAFELRIDDVRLR